MSLLLLSSIASMSLLGAMPPRPDFAIVVKNTLKGTCKDGFKTALGINCALLAHLSYEHFKKHLNKHQKKVNIAMGILLSGLAIKVILL